MKNTIILLLFSCALWGQTNKDSLEMVNLKYQGFQTNLNIKIPIGYYNPKYKDTECGGFEIFISYPDKSRIQILYDLCTELVTSDSLNQDAFSKKVTINGIQFCYYDVPKGKLRLFDKAFELLKTELKIK